MKKVVVASKNPVKIKAVKGGFARMFPEEEFEFEGVSAESGVSDQPMSDEETLMGAFNRVKNAKDIVYDVDFWVGIEGGLEKKNFGMEAFAWVVVESKDKVGRARSATFFVPEKVGKLVEEGMELGDADDVVFGRSNSKQKNGAVGLLTRNVITRTSYYEETVCLALIPFCNQDLY